MQQENAWMYHRLTFPRDSVASFYCMSCLHLETSSGIHTLHPLWTWYTNAQRVCHSMFNPSSVILSIYIYIPLLLWWYIMLLLLLFGLGLFLLYTCMFPSAKIHTNYRIYFYCFMHGRTM
jgi:hypothetical protein